MKTASGNCASRLEGTAVALPSTMACLDTTKLFNLVLLTALVMPGCTEPIELDELLDTTQPEWRELPKGNGERPAWLNDVVARLGRDIMGGINAAAAVTPISLLAFVLLATPKQKIGEAELRA